jgi:hypothetical protein
MLEGRRDSFRSPEKLRILSTLLSVDVSDNVAVGTGRVTNTTTTHLMQTLDSPSDKKHSSSQKNLV